MAGRGAPCDVSIYFAGTYVLSGISTWARTYHRSTMHIAKSASMVKNTRFVICSSLMLVVAVVVPAVAREALVAVVLFFQHSHGLPLDSEVKLGVQAVADIQIGRAHV